MFASLNVQLFGRNLKANLSQTWVKLCQLISSLS